MAPYRADYHTTTVADAARFEANRGASYDDDARPTPAELRRDAMPHDGTGEDGPLVEALRAAEAAVGRCAR